MIYASNNPRSFEINDVEVYARGLNFTTLVEYDKETDGDRYYHVYKFHFILPVDVNLSEKDLLHICGGMDVIKREDILFSLADEQLSVTLTYYDTFGKNGNHEDLKRDLRHLAFGIKGLEHGLDEAS